MKADRLPQILDAYLLAAARIEPLQSADNRVFKVETSDGRGFMLRVNHGFDPVHLAKGHVRAELGWLEYVRSTTALVVPRPVRLRSGEPYGTIEIDGGERVFVLFEWIEGEPAGRSLSRDVVRSMGRAIAQLHCTSRDFAPRPDFCAVRWDAATFLGPESWIGGGQAAVDLDSRRFEVLHDASARVRVVMEQLGRDSRQYGLIHSDTHPGNMLISNGEIAIIDFNDCGWGHYMFDLGVMLHELLGQTQASMELREAVLAGYEEVAPLPVTNEAELEAFVALRCLASLCWIARSRDPEERREALRSRPGVPIFFRQLEGFVADGKMASR